MGAGTINNSFVIAENDGDVVKKKKLKLDVG
jgi:hypothetical protein